MERILILNAKISNKVQSSIISVECINQNNEVYEATPIKTQLYSSAIFLIAVGGRKSGTNSLCNAWAEYDGDGQWTIFANAYASGTYQVRIIAFT